MRIYKLFILLLALSTLSCFAFVYKKPSQAVPASATSQPVIKAPYSDHAPVKSVEIKCPVFSRIEINNSLRVKISGGHKKQHIMVVGTPTSISQVTAEVENNTLILSQRPAPNTLMAPPALIKIELAVPLTYLETRGNSLVRAHLNSPGLTVVAHANSGIYLRGESITLSDIQSDTAKLVDIRWVKNRRLMIEGEGSGTVRLAGVTDILTTELRDLFCLEAEYLRSKEVYVQTWDYAIAKVLPIEELNAFANDTSGIYFYKVPTSIVGQSRDSGNILKVAGRN